MSIKKLAVVLLLVPLSAFGQMSHEEIVVRTAYAKYAYAVAQGVITDLAMKAMAPASAAKSDERNGELTNEQRLAADTITFLLSDFTVGNMRDIMNRNIGEFVTPHGGEVLQVGISQMNYGKAHWRSLVAQWQDAPPADALPDVSVTRALELQREIEGPNYVASGALQRFAAYAVTVNYRGKTRAYKAMFMFGRSAQGNEEVHPADSVAGNVGLGTALAERLFPEGLVATNLRSNPIVEDWLNRTQADDSSCSTLLGKGDVCCDLAHVSCGPSRAKLAQALAKPVEETVEKGKE